MHKCSNDLDFDLDVFLIGQSRRFYSKWTDVSMRYGNRVVSLLNVKRLFRDNNS